MKKDYIDVQNLTDKLKDESTIVLRVVFDKKPVAILICRIDINYNKAKDFVVVNVITLVKKASTLLHDLDTVFCSFCKKYGCSRIRFHTSTHLQLFPKKYGYTCLEHVWIKDVK